MLNFWEFIQIKLYAFLGGEGGNLEHPAYQNLAVRSKVVEVDEFALFMYGIKILIRFVEHVVLNTHFTCRSARLYPCCGLSLGSCCSSQNFVELPV